ncbi:MAG: MauE/DoxX family redox-associated membrane protein [Thermodesulfobacteriota bacterium]|nr:MauE/DoxX family redox-associated membrane protein [Thermodesulfobacteriota bacterium]
MNSEVRRLLCSNWLELVARWVLGLTFLYASCHKIFEPADFAKIIYGYYLFPDFSINLIAIILPYMELFSGLALLLGVYPRSAALIVGGMLTVFIIALTINLIRGHEFDCGCFSFGNTGQTDAAIQLLARDTIYLFLALLVIFFDRTRRWCVWRRADFD